MALGLLEVRDDQSKHPAQAPPPHRQQRAYR
jgi:hypothetical protein